MDLIPGESLKKINARLGQPQKSYKKDGIDYYIYKVKLPQGNCEMIAGAVNGKIILVSFK